MKSMDTKPTAIEYTEYGRLRIALDFDVFYVPSDGPGEDFRCRDEETGNELALYGPEPSARADITGPSSLGVDAFVDAYEEIINRSGVTTCDLLGAVNWHISRGILRIVSVEFGYGKSLLLDGVNNESLPSPKTVRPILSALLEMAQTETP